MPKKLTFCIKGVYYYDAFTAFEQAKLTTPTPLTLHPEPTNPYDKNAIQIYLNKTNQDAPCSEDILLGYIPRRLAKNLHPLLPNISAQLTHIKQKGKILQLQSQLTAPFPLWLWLKLLIIKTYQNWQDKRHRPSHKKRHPY